MHITLKSAFRGVLYIVIVWLFNLSILIGRGDLRIKNGSYDLNSDGKIERFTLNGGTSSIVLTQNNSDTLWSFRGNRNLKFTDIELIDINGDGLKDLVGTPNLFTSIGANDWLYVFLGVKNSVFSKKPYTYREVPLGQNSLKPTNLALVSNNPTMLSVSFGSPVRSAILFTISFKDSQLILKKFNKLSAPIIENGYSPVYTKRFSSNSTNYVAMLSLENNKVNSVLFNVEKEFLLSHSKSLPVGNVKSIIGSGIKRQPLSNDSSDEGLIIPFLSGDSLLLYLEKNELKIKEKKLVKRIALPEKKKKVFKEIEKIRENLESEKIKTLVKKAFNPPIKEEPSVQKSYEKYQKSVQDIPVIQTELGFDIKPENKSDYSSLSPTLGDFLESVKSTAKKEKSSETKFEIPNVNNDMSSVNWADEAGFTKLDLGEYSNVNLDTVKENIDLPQIDSEIVSFTKDARQAISPKLSEIDTSVLETSGDDIDLYYVLAMTPSSGRRDRYVFDGEAPFGIAVNQIPPKGEATHIQHGISANLANLTFGETFDFAYSLRDSRLDSITTLTMVHDMQKNVIFMSISPSDDSVSHSYQPEAFDPKLFEFPEYFFEGFPNSLDTDFTEKLIRFSFDGVKDSLYQGIYLSSTTPSIPTQSLAVFMDQGKLQAIRGEIIVRPNGFKKVTTEFDLTGKVQPEVLFSRLIKEFFPDELKIRLLQGGSLEEPLFGPKGKIPKVFREPRLPDAQTEQLEPLIPIKPKQSNIPFEEVEETEAVKTDSLKSLPQTQESEDNNIEFEDIVPKTDTLKLENRKNTLPTKKIEFPSKSQGDKKVIDDKELIEGKK